MPYHDMDWSVAGWAVMVVTAVALLIVVFGLLALILRSIEKDEAARQPVEPTPADVARLILDERLARGDIDEDDYERRRELVGRPFS